MSRTKTERAFWDTSAIVPLCCYQDASSEIRRLRRRFSRVTVWWGTTVEAISAFSRLMREGRMTERGLKQAAARLDAQRGAWSEVLPSEKVRYLAELLPEQHGLRSLD